MSDKCHSLSRLADIDWDFAGAYSESPFSALHWHPGRFASQLPAALIGILSKEGDVVLDPFAGSGTSLVEAQRLLRKPVGIDLNPVSCLVCEAKTLALEVDSIARMICEMKCESGQVLRQQVGTPDTGGPQQFPPRVQKDKWYTPTVARDLLLLWRLITGYEGAKSILGQFAFSSILLSVCRETRHWGYVCDNTTPKGEHEGHVLVEYSDVLESVERSYRLRDSELRARGKMGSVPPCQVICDETSVALRSIEPASVDLIVTSPPYFGVCDYVKAQRLTLEWMGINIEDLRLKEIGARSKRHRRMARDEYMNDLRRTMDLLKTSLKPGGICVFVIGESASRPGVVGDFCGAASNAGFSLLLELNRTVSSQRRQAPSIKGEHLLVLGRQPR